MKTYFYHEQEILPQQTDKVQDSSENFCPQVVQAAFKDKTKSQALTLNNEPQDINLKDSKN